jgi:hypothetical protein
LAGDYFYDFQTRFSLSPFFWQRASFLLFIAMFSWLAIVVTHQNMRINKFSNNQTSAEYRTFPDLKKDPLYQDAKLMEATFRDMEVAKSYKGNIFYQVGECHGALFRSFSFAVTAPCLSSAF